MAAARDERRLAAILAADVAGYSRLMERDEAGTVARLKAVRQELVEPVLARHGGRFVDLKGDGAIIEFGSAVAAVEAAVEIQRAMAEREAGVPEAERIRYRIGINLGDVVVDGPDIYGDGVNVAARIEGLCEPGGVWVAARVYDPVRGKLDVPFEPAGRHRVKNLSEPVETFRVRLEGGSVRRRALTRVRPGWRAAAAAAALLGLVALAAGGAWWLWPGEAAAGKPSVAVLPLANLSGDPRWERFADGITEDLITDLARDPDLHVIARNSTATYKGKAVDVRRVGQELGVRYVLEGSLRAETGRVRVTAQLVDASTGGHLWAERYDRPEADLFAIQDEVARNVAGALGGWYGRLNKARRDEARRAGRRRAWRPTTSTCSAWSRSTGTRGRPCRRRSGCSPAPSSSIPASPAAGPCWGWPTAWRPPAASSTIRSPPTGCGSSTRRKPRTSTPSTRTRRASSGAFARWRAI